MPLPSFNTSLSLSLFALFPIELTPSAPLPSKTCLQFKAALHFFPPLTLLTVKVCNSLLLTGVVNSGSCTVFNDSLKMVFLSTALIAPTSHLPYPRQPIAHSIATPCSKERQLMNLRALLHLHCLTHPSEEPKFLPPSLSTPVFFKCLMSLSMWLSTVELSCCLEWNKNFFFIIWIRKVDSDNPTKVHGLHFLLMLGCECFCKVLSDCNTPWLDSFPSDIGDKLFAVASHLVKTHSEFLKLLKVDCTLGSSAIWCSFLEILPLFFGFFFCRSGTHRLKGSLHTYCKGVWFQNNEIWQCQSHQQQEWTVQKQPSWKLDK